MREFRETGEERERERERERARQKERGKRKIERARDITDPPVFLQDTISEAGVWEE